MQEQKGNGLRCWTSTRVSVTLVVLSIVCAILQCDDISGVSMVVKC